ncbi:hypothetical protein CoNPh17_CDS0136 [Staphylococcus phage S-CoN_Ph17]|nr:hypothetical protein CoNPh17_CDS0136 [Staphylococcus phage S-CoN_Ph17]
MIFTKIFVNKKNILHFILKIYSKTYILLKMIYDKK